MDQKWIRYLDQIALEKRNERTPIPYHFRYINICLDFGRGSVLLVATTTLSQHANVDFLTCPETRLPLRALELATAESALGGSLIAARASEQFTEQQVPFGPTAQVMVRADNRCAYPIVNGVPVLLVPEMLIASTNPHGMPRSFDLSDPRYAEAYEEMAFYNQVAEKQAGDIEHSEIAKTRAPLIGISDAERATFPQPAEKWLDAPYDAQAQMDGYLHIAPIAGKRVLQVGGSGSHAVKLLVAGAAEAWLITPMHGETSVALALARLHGVEAGMRCVVGVAEQIPFADSTFDALFSGGCMHHTVTDVALPECARVLRPGGKFAAFEPWKAPLYSIGTRIFGKRETEVYCKPFTQARANPLFTTFSNAQMVHHGAFTRYPLLAMSKLGIRLQLPTIYGIVHADDVVTSKVIPPLRKWGSSISLLGTRS